MEMTVESFILVQEICETPENVKNSRFKSLVQAEMAFSIPRSCYVRFESCILMNQHDLN